MALRTDFKDDILANSDGRREYQLIHNDNGTVSLIDVTDYSQTGSEYGAKEVNEEREVINDSLYTPDKTVKIGNWGSTWSLSTTAKNIGSKLDAVDNYYYTATTGADAAITIKQDGLYSVHAYSQASAAASASASVISSVHADDVNIIWSQGYSYNGFSVNIESDRTVYLTAGTVLTAKLSKTSASGDMATTGSSYLEVTKLAG